ncbi:MAG TPA: SRPBCC domain-containing protein [Thermoanaerobaculia bacterium]
MSLQVQEDAFVITRTFDAPRDLVFEVFTQPEHLQQWFAPKGFTVPHCTVDLRVGGTFHYCMRSPEGNDYWARGIFQEVAPPARIVYADSFADAEGNAVSPSFYGMTESHPAETLVHISFDARGDATIVTLRHELPESVVERGSTQQGWLEMFERVEAVLLHARAERITT